MTTTIEALTSDTAASTEPRWGDMERISEGQLPEGIRFEVRPENQGQTVEYSHASYDGDLYVMRHDHSAQTTQYRIAIGRG